MANVKNSKKVSPEQDLQQNLEKTEIGQMIEKYKNLAFAAVALALSIVVAVVVYNQYTESRNSVVSKLAYQFEEGPLVDYKNKKIKSNEFISAIEKFQEESKGHNGFITVLLRATQELKTQKDGHLIIDLINKTYEQQKKNKFFGFFLGITLATLYEDKGELDQAISLLEGLVSFNDKFLGSKLYLDLGRLYKIKGNKDKAKLNFNYIVENFPQDDMAKLARIYVNEL